MSTLPSPADVVLSFDVPAPARDGAVLRCNVARPAGSGRWPVIVSRTPYGKDASTPSPLFDLVGLAREGFAVVLQDVRQRFASDGAGDFVPFVHDAADGADLVAWAAAQPWSTGEVLASGVSYGGFAGWAAATAGPPALKAFAAAQSPSTAWRSFFFRGGVPELGGMAAWFLGLGVNTLMRRHADDPGGLGAALERLVAEVDGLASGGLAELPLAAFGPVVRAGVAGPMLDVLAADADTAPPLLRALEAAQQVEQITVPALIVGGWYDYFVQGAFDQFVALRARGGSAAARARTRLIVGPWTHGLAGGFAGERSFGVASAPGAVGRGGLRGELLRFFREQLGDTTAKAAPVKLFVMGANTWRDEWEWPLARTRLTPWYLASGGHANGLAGDGELAPEPRPGPPDRYRYDPADPVPTWGGTNLGATELAGARDQRPIERRGDVLVYTSAVLAEPLEVTGTVVVELWAVSSAPDTDVVARLVDVAPDGTAYNLADGMLRARNRDTAVVRGAGVPLTPDEPTLLRVELTPTSNLFRAGHRIRIDITGGSFPRWARNLQIWEQRGATLADAVVAQQTVFHDELHPSRVLLPVIPPA